MGIVDRLFPKKKHARGSAPAEDPDEAGYTRAIAREGEAPAPRRDDADPWSDSASRTPAPAPSRDDPMDAPTLAPPRPAPAPPPRYTPPPPRREAPRAPVAEEGPGDDATVLGPAFAAPVRGSIVAVLVGIDGALDGHLVRVFDGENVLGREGSPEPLPNRQDTKTISRQHARLRADGGDFMIEPVRPENATFVNDQLIEAPQLLQHGDRLRLGATKPSTFVLLVVP
jgi:hypothetical protein